MIFIDSKVLLQIIDCNFTIASFFFLGGGLALLNTFSKNNEAQLSSVCSFN